MTHPVWPLFDLRVSTPRLELRYIDDDLMVDLALLAAKGVHDPGFMPFAVPWTDHPSPQLERQAMQFHWRCRADATPQAWIVNLAVIVDGSVAGTTGLITNEFPTMRQFETGSWLGREFQGRGIGKEMREASLHLGFAGFDGLWATTGAFEDNGPSLGVTRSLGYAEAGRRRVVRRGTTATTIGFEMPRADWETRLRRTDIEIEGIDACRDLLGIGENG